jgi:predicted ATP-grasp superfamily ATP-dependent carboligase
VLERQSVEPPCIVLGVETQIGLSIVRELGMAGVPVIAISHDARAIGLASRFVSRRAVVSNLRSAETIDLVNRLSTELGPCTLMTVSEANLQWLLAHKSAFDAAVRVVVPDAAALAAVLDKRRTLDAAQRVGVNVPRTEEPASLEELDRIADGFPYPAVLKWKDANAVAPRLAAAGIAFVKAEYVDDATALKDVGRRYADLNEWPLIQQYCKGQGLGQFFFMHEGQAVRRFQHLRIAEWPPEGGFSSVCDAMPLEQHLELQDRSIALLKELQWQGVAMVEYRYDAASGNAVLMEINGRFWGSLPLAFHAGAGFALLAHRAAHGMPLTLPSQPRTDLRCRMVVTELKRLFRIVVHPELIADRHFLRRPVSELMRFIADFLRPRRRYYVWWSRDPMPWVRDVCRMVAGLAGR